MDYTTLGRTGLRVSRLWLGTANFGLRTPEAESVTMLNHALDAGINVVDTADVYGIDFYHNTGGPGVAEALVGRWLAANQSRRQRVVLASKVGHPAMMPGSGLSARHIIRACEDSLRRLHTDWIDLYQMHHVDRSAPWDEVWTAMERLITAGKVLYVGSSNFAGWHIAAAQEAAHAHKLPGLAADQSVYNLSKRAIEAEVLPACRAYGIASVAYSPLGQGILSGVTSGVSEGSVGRRASHTVQALFEQQQAQITQYNALCAELGHPPAQVAHAWLLHQPDICAVAVGPRTLEQFTHSLESLAVQLSSAALAALDALWPGPGPRG